jgi:drug/metabolite transporter (DMT)-like permease
VDHTPAADQTFFLCFLGYWAQTLVGAAFAFWPPRRPGNHLNPLRGAWTPPVLSALAASAALDGAAQALDYVGQVQGGYMLFTIFHASVTVFSCCIAVLLLKTQVTGPQWVGVALIVAGVFVTALPSPIEVTGNFSVGLGASLLGSLCLAASYPFSELVFVRGSREPAGRLTEEMACVAGSLLNTCAFTLWTMAYTLPRWHATVGVYTLPGHGAVKTAGFVFYALMVGLHSLSFWKSIYRLGTVPTAVAKGAQQAGVFACSHLFFCHVDESECIDYNYGNSLWNRLQKSVAFALCCLGVAVYSLNKRGHLPFPLSQHNLPPLIEGCS